MDMKRILQAMDGVATKPVVGADSMAKFLSIIDKNASVQVLNENKTPHKVSLPVQMAMQHYQQADSAPVSERKSSLISKYFHQVEQEIAEEKSEKQQLIKQYSQLIAERVMMKEAANPAQQAAIAIAKKKKKIKENEIPGHSMGFKPGPGGPGMMPNESSEHDDLKDLQTELWDFYKDVHGFRPRHWSREEWNDIDFLHKQQQNLINIIDNMSPEERKENGWLNENELPKPIKPKKKTSVCKTGQVQTGMQTKDGKLVPKCSVTGIKK